MECEIKSQFIISNGKHIRLVKSQTLTDHRRHKIHLRWIIGSHICLPLFSVHLVLLFKIFFYKLNGEKLNYNLLISSYLNNC